MPQDDAALIEADALSAIELCDLYIASHHLLKRVVDESMQAAGLSLARTKLMMQLSDRGPVRQQVLAEWFGFAPRSITDMVDGLERDGLAERLDDPEDRRAKLVRLTPTGESMLAAAIDVRLQLVDRVFGGMSPADRAELARLIRVIDDATGAIPKPSAAHLVLPLTH